jgi:hypothetical protein
MKNKIYISFLFVIVFFVSDNVMKKEDGFVFVISDYIKNQQKVKKFAGISEKGTYSDFNFIIYNDTTMYYHFSNEEKKIYCGTALEEMLKKGIIDTTKTDKPYKLNLTPNALKIFDSLIVKKKIDNRFYEFSPDEYSYIITVSSNNNIVENKDLKKIFKFFNYRSCSYVFRKLTEEQQFVSDAKFFSKKYDLDKINWKIGFSKKRKY